MFRLARTSGVLIHPEKGIERGLSRKEVPALGRKLIGTISFEHARPEELLPAQQVTEEHIDGVVREFGRPWDIMTGALRRSREEMKNYVIADVGPNIVEEATTRAYGQAFSSQFYSSKVLKLLLLLWDW
ncbi:MAG: hypothetical protein ACTSVD_10005 [Candidatus Thorarchaeota archaeon]